MKFLSIFFLIFVFQGVVSKKVDLPQVNIKSITTFDPPGFIIGWQKINSSDVIGYKVRIWEVQGDTLYHYEIVDGKKKLVPSISPPEIKTDVIPKNAPKEIIVQGGDVTEVKFENAKEGVLYEIRVLGFTTEGDGPMSTASGVMIGD